MRHPRLHCGVHEGAVLVEAVDSFAGRDHEQRGNTVEGAQGGVRVGVGEGNGRGPGQCRGARGGAGQQSLLDAFSRQIPGDDAAEGAGGARDGQ